VVVTDAVAELASFGEAAIFGVVVVVVGDGLDGLGGVLVAGFLINPDLIL
jgi:hypothetical protein